MADKEKNTPVEDPKNLEEIIDSEPTSEVTEKVADEYVEETTVEETTEDGVEEMTSEAPTEEVAEEVIEEPTEEAPVDEVAEEVIEEPTEEAPVEEVAEEVIEEPTEEAPVEEVTEEVIEEPTEEAPAEEVAEDDDGPSFEIGITESGEVYLIHSDEEDLADLDEDEDEDEETEDSSGGDDGGGFDLGEDHFVPDEGDDEITVDPDDLIVREEVVDSIRAEGAKLTGSENDIKAYLKRSKKAIKNLEAALKVAQRALDANRDDREAPVILVGIIKICGEILEIKCDNLENIARIHAHNYIKEARTSLHYEIDRYNDFVITYASLTGEQLTRMSTLLPENIASGRSLAVVPSLSYVESYVQVKDGSENDVNTMAIVPMLGANDFIGDLKPPVGRCGAASFGRKVKRGIKKLNRQKTKIAKLISENKILRKRYESEIHSLEASTPLADRATAEYRDKVFAINIRYGKMLIGIETLKASSAFTRTRQSLIINRMAIEREKLTLAYENMRVAYREGSAKQKRTARRLLEDVIRSYNQTSDLTIRATGMVIEKLPDALVEYSCRGREIKFPTLAYKRSLVETVGTETRSISMAPKLEVEPDEVTYSEQSEKVLHKHGGVRNPAELSPESMIVDRASAIAKVMIESLRESADLVITADELEQFEIKSRRAYRYFKRALKGTERAMARGFDDNAVITALVENLRVIANIVEVKRLSIAVAKKLHRNEAARSHSRSLFKYIELYNSRSIDYMSVVGERFSRITVDTADELVGSAEKIKVPVITYKDNYIEVFPKDPLADSTYEKPRMWRSGVYTPLMMHHYRLTENRAVETTVVNSPFVFDVMVDEHPAVSWWHPIGVWQHLIVVFQPIIAWFARMYTNSEILLIEESLLFSRAGITAREYKVDRKQQRFERKLKRLNDQRDAAILNLETVINESDRNSASYQKKLYKINSKFSRKVYNLRVRWMRECPSRNSARLLLERFVLERERIAGLNKLLLKYRNYGRVTLFPNALNKFKKTFIRAVNAHNQTAEQLSEVIGVKFSQISTSVADEIIRYGKMIKLPEIICCREIIETIDGKQRTVGDKWHGYGLYTGTSGAPGSDSGAPIMSVGAMGYATEMGVPFLKSNIDGLTMLGMTPGGVPLIGFSDTGETTIPFTGTPMMLAGTDGSIILDAGMYGRDSLILGAADVTDPHSGINRRGVDGPYTEDAEEEGKDIHYGANVETPIDLESKMIEERFRKSLRVRSMTSVDNTANWWKLLFSEINVALMRKLAVRAQGFLRVLLPKEYINIDLVSTRLDKDDETLLHYIARVGGIIEIECKKLYSASKTGVRRSQRVWSGWLHEDIEVYNKLVKQFNAKHERHMHLEPISLNLPDTIRFRKEERPPVPPVLSLRNRVKVDEAAAPLKTDEIYGRLIQYATFSQGRYIGSKRKTWLVRRIHKLNKRGKHMKALNKIYRVIKKRTASTDFRRMTNDENQYQIRYEKGRAMKRYNKRVLDAIGIANDPIKYQARVHKVLRKYLSNNFRIDYNMRIHQLIYRAISIDSTVYWVGVAAVALAVIISGFLNLSDASVKMVTMFAFAWASLPIVLGLLKLVYILLLVVINLFFYVPRFARMLEFGGIDVERNRYGTILDCFVCEQHRLLLHCERVRQKPKSTTFKKLLIAAVNDYNRKAETYSEILKVPIKTIETTELLDKLTSGDVHELIEIQNFTYVRELVERVDSRDVGKKLDKRELNTLVEEINRIINSINLAGATDQVAVDFLQGAMQRLIGYLQSDIKPTQHDKFELKRDLIEAIALFDIGVSSKEIFTKNVIKVVDQLGGKSRRRIIGVLAEDDMIN